MGSTPGFSSEKKSLLELSGVLGVREELRPKFAAKPVTGEAQALYDRITDVMRDSVGKHMIADPDVSVGVFLSGGIDSTAIATLAKEVNPNLIAFTAGFTREGYSEVDVAAETTAAIGVRHVVRTVSAVEMMEAPREARRHVKAVLSGEGADEL